MSWLDQLAEIRKTNWNEATEAERDAKSHDVILISAYAGAAASIVPVPMAELAVLLPVHTAMVMTVGHVQGRSISRAEAARVAMELGAIAGLTFAGTAALTVLRKIVLPGIGGVLAAPASFALTWGLGRAAMAYFQNPALRREELRAVFKEAFSEGKSTFSKEHFDRWRRRHGEGQSVVDEAEAHADRSAEAPAAQDASQEDAPEAQTGVGERSPSRASVSGSAPVEDALGARDDATPDEGPSRAPDRNEGSDSGDSNDDPTLRPRKRSL